MPLPKILIVQHNDKTPPGLSLSWIQERNLPYQLVHMMNDPSLPPLESFDHVILCGGGMNVDQDEKYPWLAKERELIVQSLAQKKKIVGLCLGGQLCAQVLGARVYPHPRGWEIGWHEISFLENSKSLHFFQFHRYVFELPPEATVFAQNSWWQIQGFIWKNQVLGFQFHPEAEIPWTEHCLVERKEPTSGQVQELEAVLRSGEVHQPVSRQWFFDILDQFLLERLPV